MQSGVTGTVAKRVLIDQVVPTSRSLQNRKPDLVVRLRDRKLITIFDVACTWEPLVNVREFQKGAKYQALAADLAKQWEGYKVRAIPVVVGDLGLMEGLQNHLKRSERSERSELLSPKDISHFLREAQREVLCVAARLIRRHLSNPG